jgi:hypothetical protein
MLAGEEGMTGRRFTVSAPCLVPAIVSIHILVTVTNIPHDLRCDVDKPRAPLPLRGRLPQSVLGCPKQKEAN